MAEKKKPLPDPEKNLKKFFGTLLTGLIDEFGKPIAEDVVKAYRMYRAARARYPAVDGVLNFVPYVGAAANADDIASDVANKQYSDIPADAIGAAVNLALAKKGFSGVASMAKSAAGVAGPRTAAKVSLIGGAFPAVAYVNHYLNAQEEANKKYKNMPLSEIAKVMYPDMK